MIPLYAQASGGEPVLWLDGDSGQPCDAQGIPVTLGEHGFPIEEVNTFPPREPTGVEEFYAHVPVQLTVLFWPRAVIVKPRDVDPGELPHHVLSAARDALERACLVGDLDPIARDVVEAVARRFSSASEANGEAGALALQVSRLDVAKLAAVGDRLAASMDVAREAVAHLVDGEEWRITADDLRNGGRMREALDEWRALRGSGVGESPRSAALRSWRAG